MRTRDRLARLARMRAVEVGGAARLSGARHAEARQVAGSLARIDALLGTLPRPSGPISAGELAADAGQRTILREARDLANARSIIAERRSREAEHAVRGASARADAVDRLRTERRATRDRLVEQREREDAPAWTRCLLSNMQPQSRLEPHS